MFEPQLPSHSFSGDFDASNDVFDIIHSRTDAIRTCSDACLQRFLTDVHMHRLTATISVYPAKFTKKGSNRRLLITRQRHCVERTQNSQGEPPVFHNNNIVIVIIDNVAIKRSKIISDTISAML